MSKNKKKTAREKRILVGAFLTAVVIAAGSTFAWFTSTDTVTNRLSANADYDVKIVESFAPPANWIPGQKVDKDVYAVNTGSIEAFAKATVSGVMSMTREVPVPIDEVGGSAAHGVISAHWVAYEKIDGVWTEKDVESGFDENSVTGIGSLPGDITDKPYGASHYKTSQSGEQTIYYYYKHYAEQGAADESWNVGSATYDCVTLNEKERYVIEAGAYLAYCPSTDLVNKDRLGNQVIAFNETGATNVVDGAYQNIGEGNKTDFTPHADGLYVFRRKIVVNTEGNAAGTETFEYDGYYYLGGRYYKIMNLNVTHDDVQDVVAEGNTKDGLLTRATACLVKEEKLYGIQPDSFRYDAANNRIVVSYETNTENGLVGDKDNLTDLAAKLDKAEHDLQEAEVRLERAIEDSGIVAGSVKAKTKAVDDAQLAYDRALADYNAAVAEYKQALENYKIGKAAFTNAQTEAQNALTGLVGATATNTVKGIPLAEDSNAVLAANPDSDEVTVPADGAATLTSNLKDATGAAADPVGAINISTSDTTSPAYAYIKALNDYNTWEESNLATTAGTDEEDHQIYTYLRELYNDSKNTPQTDPILGNYYTAPENDKFGTFANENAPDDVDHEDLVNELKYAATRITYQYAINHVHNPASGTFGELHQYHQLLTALQIAENKYNTALADYNEKIGNLNKAIDDLGVVAGSFEKIATDTVVRVGDDTTPSTIMEKNAWNSGDAETLKEAYKTLKNEDADGDQLAENVVTAANVVRSVEDIQALTDTNKPTESSAEYNLWNAWQELQNAEKDLASVENQTYIKQEDPDQGLPYAGPLYDADGNPTNVDNPQVKENLKAAWDNYYAKKNIADELERRLNAAQNGFEKDGDLLIYIYLTNNVTLTGDTACKWQLLPTDINANKEAVFYYTSILGAGEVSSQLIDYVELDKSVNQYMYKYFDFDLNVTLDSAQVHFNEDGSRSTQAADEAFDTTKYDVSGKIQNPMTAPATPNLTVVTWSVQPVNNTTPGGGDNP